MLHTIVMFSHEYNYTMSLYVYSYIDGRNELQVEFVELVDKLCEPGKTYKQITRYYSNNIIIVHIHALVFVSRFLKECGITSSVVNPESLMAPNSKLNSQQLYKLGLRFVEKYNLKLGESLSPSLSPPPPPPLPPSLSGTRY